MPLSKPLRQQNVEFKKNVVRTIDATTQTDEDEEQVVGATYCPNCEEFAIQGDLQNQMKNQVIQLDDYS